MPLQQLVKLQSINDTSVDENAGPKDMTRAAVEESLRQSQDLVVDSEPPYQCKICEKVFAIPARLQRHHRVHTGEKPFKCEYCEKRFSVKENLNVHRRIHTKERPYQCTMCSRAFEHSGKINRHMRTHTGERPHKCDLCGKTFVQSGQLVIHMRAHTGEKPYTCDYCHKGFTCSKQLKVHIRTHTGEKPYECDICGKTFGYNHVLKMHKMSHLAEKMYKCTLCEEFFNSRKVLDKHIKEHSQESTKEFHQGQQASNRIHNKESYKGISSHPSRQVVDNRVPGISPLCVPLTPPLSPESVGPSVHRPSHQVTQQKWRYHEKQVNADSTDPHVHQIAYFTTINGQKLACQPDLLVRLQDRTYESDTLKLQREIQEKVAMQQELQARIKIDDERKQKEQDFFDSVLRVLESCIGIERMERLGYPEDSIDAVIMKTLKLMGTEPCWEPSLAPMDRVKVNLRLLFECCVPDKLIWDKFGWKGKSIEDIVLEFFQQC